MESRIAIVGGGPKGIYGLERLTAELKITAPRRESVEIHLFNRTPFFGSGDIYRTDQPDYLLMNFSNGHVDMWSRGAPAPVVSPALGFSDWLDARNFPGVSSDPRSYSPRSVTGAYLTDGFKAISDACPDHITLHTHVAEVTGLRSVGTGFALETSSDNVNQRVRDSPFHWILVCTGHPRHAPDAEILGLQQFAQAHPGVHYVNFVYPVAEKLHSIRPDSNVAIKGLGLTFIDAVLALTEGRGGTFAAGQQGRLRYVPSGREPAVLFPFSRSGLTMIPRGVTYGLPRRPLNYFNAPNVPQVGPVDFDLQIWPLIQRDMMFAYYEILFQNHGLRLRPDRDHARLTGEIERFHSDHPGTHRFDPVELLQPFDQRENLHDHTLDFMRRATAGAEQGELKSPLSAAAAVWRHATPLFSEIYRCGGLTAASHRSFLSTYAGHLNRLAFGPPVVNMQKVIAVAEAGLLDFSFARNPAVRTDPVAGRFTLHHAGNPGITQRCEVLIDARIPKTFLQADASPLYRALIKAGHVRAFSNAGFEPGCVDIDPAGNAIGIGGCPNDRLTFYGTPTEGVTWDNDTLSRSHNDFASGWARRVARDLPKAIAS